MQISTVFNEKAITKADGRLGDLTKALEDILVLVDQDDDSIDLCTLLIKTKKIQGNMDSITNSLLNDFIRERCNAYSTLTIGFENYPIVDGMIDVPDHGRLYFAAALRVLTGLESGDEFLAATKLLDKGRIPSKNRNISVH